MLRALPTTLDAAVHPLVFAMQGTLPTPMMVLHVLFALQERSRRLLAIQVAQPARRKLGIQVAQQLIREVAVQDIPAMTVV